MHPKKLAPRKSAFVPRVIFRAAVSGVSVVPLCAAGALAEVGPGCSSSTTGLGVAAQCFCDGSTKVASVACCSTGPQLDGPASGDDSPEDTGMMGVADTGFMDVIEESIGHGVADVGFSVADVGFRDVGVHDGHVSDAHTSDVGGHDVADAPSSGDTGVSDGHAEGGG
jgi:hypothetical protein